VARWLLPLVLVALLPASASAASFEGTKWKVTRIAGQPVAEFGLKLDFSDRQVSGNDGCNRYSARYRVTGARIRFRRFISTAIGCEGTTIPSITDRLRRTRRYRLHGKRLELRRSGKTLVVLKRR
jgi:heat shock protein HslJ